MNKKIFFVISLFLFQLAFADEFTLRTESKFKPDYLSRFSLLAGLNPSATKTNQIKNVHLSYSRNNLDNQWWDFNFSITKGFINKLTSNNSAATTLTTDQFNEQTDSTNLTFGVGVNYETHYAQTILPFNGMYELIGASVTYNIFKNALAANTFNGPGLIAKYSLLKKFNDFVSFGGNFIYNLAVVKRAQNTDTETSSKRSLTLSYLTVGIDLSFYL